ncbi:MAG: hypothetical protein ACYCOU_00730 [Sulfobacillus sp.]
MQISGADCDYVAISSGYEWRVCNVQLRVHELTECLEELEQNIAMATGLDDEGKTETETERLSSVFQSQVERNVLPPGPCRFVEALPEKERTCQRCTSSFPMPKENFDILQSLGCLLVLSPELPAPVFFDKYRESLGIFDALESAGISSAAVFNGWRHLPTCLLLGRAVTSLGYFSCPELELMKMLRTPSGKNVLLLVYDGKNG